MQLIAGRTAQEYNQRKNRKGAFWEDRYHATAIDTQSMWQMPGAQYVEPAANTELHDSESNSIPNWAAIGGDTATHRWDKQCIMSYENNNLYFCGKCKLRNRGWKVQTLGYPGPDIEES
ncbi:Transposase and inactivated derivatives [hydrothermal vent metagenome]|uniref:Transposase and inactivated derivatives n=1 Tax=hydrothermal vent metagenome TaxID=652676 RepID=A0A3B0XT35_9ZZZZ